MQLTKIRETLGTLLITPGDTRWNSVYDAVSRINLILTTPDLEAKFDKLCDDFEIRRLQPIQKTFIAEYIKVMGPLCQALDILQGEKAVSLGYLLPTLHIINTQLDDLLHSANNELTICEPLLLSLKTGIQQRFGDLMNKVDAKLAAVTIPKFKLDWVGDPIQRSHLLQLLKRRGSSLSADHQAAQSQSHADRDQDHVNTGTAS